MGIRKVSNGALKIKIAGKLLYGIMEKNCLFSVIISERLENGTNALLTMSYFPNWAI